MRILVFQHLASEHPGAFLDHAARDGVFFDTVELDEGGKIPALEAYDALWVMGGAMDVWDVEDHPWLIDEKRAIRRWVREIRKPYVGICLGHQLLADALGGTCGPMPTPEVGMLGVSLTEPGERDPLLAGTPRTSRVLQWHGVRVAEPPDGAVALATSSACQVQAMRVGDRSWGLQYHVEARPETVADWASVPEYRSYLESAMGQGAMERLDAEMRAEAPTVAETVSTVWQNFLRIARG
jgi:GMP synthase-like glutamine amidotransferase